MLEYKMNINGELVSGFLADMNEVKELGYDIKPLENDGTYGFYRAEYYHDDIECAPTQDDSYASGDDSEGEEIVNNEFINIETDNEIMYGFVSKSWYETDQIRKEYGEWGLNNNESSEVANFRRKVIDFDEKYDLDSKFWQKELADDCKEYNKDIEDYCKDKETLFDTEILHAEDILRLVLDEDFVEKFIKEWEI